MVSQLNCKHQQQNVSSSRVTRHGRCAATSKPHTHSPLFTTFDFRIKIQLTCVSPLVQLRKGQKTLWLFYSILVLIFFCFLCPFDYKHERKRVGDGAGMGDESSR